MLTDKLKHSALLSYRPYGRYLVCRFKDSSRKVRNDRYPHVVMMSIANQRSTPEGVKVNVCEKSQILF